MIVFTLAKDILKMKILKHVSKREETNVYFVLFLFFKTLALQLSFCLHILIPYFFQIKLGLLKEDILIRLNY